MARLSGKVAIVTGAAQGMGASHARMMAEQGAKVVMTDLNITDGQKIADDIGENALFIQQDVTSAADWENVISQAEAAFGNVNVLVNNAGILGPVESLDGLSEETYRKVCDINQMSVFLGMQAVIPSMIKAGVGSIVNISSVAGMVAIYGCPNLAYIASKFAVRGMTKQVAVDYGSKNIRANSIHPGFIKTPMMAAATDEDGGAAASLIPLGRLAEPSEVSNLVIFLASDESSFISAEEHVIDGGMIAH
ncbi:glucose 1-dehydrogenase [Halioxenophilus aromaticivorans]|uniref:SDR family oxidoreductase n=1 Tax=Halioxenophilus aromaticivorans TaxID=1306992 RepID=A0AAV3TXT4_9ALTE